MNLQNKTILITGIGGCVGQRLAELAVQKGAIVKGLQRSPLPAGWAEPLGIELFQGSITDSALATKACQGVDIVVHTAAIVKEDGDLQELRAVNVGGSLTVAQAAKNIGVKTFVQISSVMVYGFQYPDQVTETGPFYTGKNAYCLTKLESDQAVLKLNGGEFGVIVIRPGDIYGSRSDPWVVRPLQMMRDRKFVLLDQGQGIINHVYIDNLIDAIFLAIEQEAYGEAFNITDGCQTTWKEYYLRLAQLENLQKLPSVRSRVAKIVLRILPKGLMGVLPDAIDVGSRRHTYSIQKAIQQLGYQPRISLDEGMAKIAAELKAS
jgi:nucleoside-diphosphate-sugar epimerase